jgi:hypothetical protein
MPLIEAVNTSIKPCPRGAVGMMSVDLVTPALVSTIDVKNNLSERVL